MTKIITAIEQDGMNVRTLTIVLNILDENIDIKDAIKKACNEYVNTKDGFNIYSYNCELFNWADFEANVPNEICRKYGFEKMNSVTSEDDVDWDEQLVDNIGLNDEQFEDLKTQLLIQGYDAVKDFIGFDYNENDDEKVIYGYIDDIASQMPDEEQMQYYFKWKDEIMKRKISNALSTINLNFYDLGGVEICDEDIDNIARKCSTSDDIKREIDEYLYSIREVLDEGLEDDENNDELKSYDFTFKVSGFHKLTVKATSDENAEKKALQEICNVDFGYLENIDSEIYTL